MKTDSGFEIPDESSKFFFPIASDFSGDVFPMFFDGEFRDVEFFCNFLGSISLLDEGNKLELTEGKISYWDMRWHVGIVLGLGQLIGQFYDNLSNKES
ncbi:hypothetical protein PQG22_13745, partial [Aquirufa beregesia]